jgi:hypothetical protein
MQSPQPFNRFWDRTPHGPMSPAVGNMLFTLEIYEMNLLHSMYGA